MFITFDDNGCQGIEPVSSHTVGHIVACHHMKEGLHSMNQECPKLDDDDKKIADEVERGDGAILEVQHIQQIF